MAKINHLGNITANCPGCNGALSSYQWEYQRLNKRVEYGSIDYKKRIKTYMGLFQHRLYKCTGCGKGALAVIMVKTMSLNSQIILLI